MIPQKTQQLHLKASAPAARSVWSCFSPDMNFMSELIWNRFSRSFYNLLDNAIKFSNDNSSVQIETTVKSGKVFVSVKDYGTGIPKESLGKIWDRFYKIDASRGKDRKGTGLGLSIVKEIINAHNQNIDVISTEGVGTEFIFTLEKTK